MMGEVIQMAHGSGGKLSRELVGTLFLPRLENPILAHLDDAAVLEVRGDGRPAGRLPAGPSTRWAFTTDSYVVKPLFFPGGDIGRLAVSGTVNDLAMMGARPLWLSAGFILEEGLPIDQLRRIVDSMRGTAAEAGVQIVAGDTKVVERGGADGLFINTAGLGLIPEGVEPSGAGVKAGDVVILSGSIGDHGIAVVSRREGFQFDAEVESDVAPLNRLVAPMLEACPTIHALRDPTRGGLATILNEIASQSKVRIVIEEERIPLKDSVRAACEMLGYDPLYVANEGKLAAFVAPDAAAAVLQAMRDTRYGREAAVIGHVAEGPAGQVLLKTRIGGTRFVRLLAGELLPRIC
jgi:hydrogenase expression/formation protein HypE